MTPEESLAPWVLLLEQESYRSNLKRMIKKILQTTDRYTTILKNRLQNHLDTIVGEHQSEAIKNTITLLYTLFLLFAT